ncbi:S8 family serine peptidase [Rhizobium sp. CF080]|uniref:S8 family serine peptidase n=1 Tax=Rhizobium sp. (strain CF080) TaxID=1144310 RepID=UPI0018CC1657|nr:S8 family serine peptidase [Rhizobium sp. CF080]
MLALTISGSPSRAEDPNSPRAWTVRAVDGMPDELRIQLAKDGRPSYETVENGTQTLNAIIAEICGDQPAKVKAELVTEAEALNKQPADVPVGPDVTVAVPFCMRLDRNILVDVKENDTVESLLKEHYGVYGNLTKAKTYAVNEGREADNSAEIEEAFKSIRTGRKVLLPFGAKIEIFEPKAGGIALPDAVKQLAGPGLAAAINNSVKPVTVPQTSDPTQLALIESVEIASAGGDTPCSSSEDINVPIDLAALRDEFKWERDQLAKNDGDMKTVTIGVIDTGLAAPDDGFFVPTSLARNSQEMNGQMGADDDIPPNGAIDDIFGVNLNMNPATGNVIPYQNPDLSWKFHGTRMASLVLGGPKVDVIWAPRPPLRIKVVNFASSKMDGGMVPTSELDRALGFLGASGAVVVNMSLATRLNIIGITNSIRSFSNNTLFVVAAGNSRLGPGEDIGLNAAYPALLGGFSGQNRENVITVGAHGRSGKRATFSNYSSQFVDLLAPGCGVETRDGTGSTVLDSGTSPAAALVSFTGGLIAALDIAHPKDIKNRILVSVDVDHTELAEDAWSRGRLNALKAISLRRDVIELSNGQLKLGGIADRSPLMSLCADRTLPSPSKIYKVMPNIKVGNDAFIEYWSMNNDYIHKMRCKQVQGSNARIVLDGASFAVGDIRDVVFRWR